MSFKDRSFAERFNQLGDEAEGIFESVYPQGWVRTGLDRPPLRMSQLPAVVRYTPDYLTSKGYVEVQGFGRDQLAKFKPPKLTALAAWDHTFRVDFFLWDSHQHRYGWVRFGDLMMALRTHDLHEYHDGGQYFAVAADRLPMASDWVPYGERFSATR